MVALQGGRQVGKSTLAGLLAEKRGGHVVTMDNDPQPSIQPVSWRSTYRRRRRDLW
ncbi:hypothetical protein [Corynebacterium glyciniphilum]|uniref:hypothetical protein n=1 Tax=Corynebacterium glyciniphilum TaxID=1404244 RepID=UPI003DA11DA4